MTSRDPTSDGTSNRKNPHQLVVMSRPLRPSVYEQTTAPPPGRIERLYFIERKQ